MEQSPSWEANGSAASQEIPCIFGIRRFITVPTSARHLSLSWANSIQSSQPPPTSWRSILILSSHLCLGLPSGTKILYFIYISGVLKRLVTPVWVSYIRKFTWRGRIRKVRTTGSSLHRRDAHVWYLHLLEQIETLCGCTFQEKSSGWLHSQVAWSTADSQQLPPLSHSRPSKLQRPPTSQPIV